MRLISYRTSGGRGVGRMVDESGFASVAKHAPELPASLAGILGLGDEALARARIATEGVAPDGWIEEVTLLPVIPEPPAIWCVGVNYEAHRKETGREPTEYPTLFMRIAASQVGHGQAIVRPKVSTMLDYEGELAVIIGTAGRHIAEAQAMRHVAGYSCYNDGSVRDWQRHTSQFGPGKNFYRTGGFGPWLVTADELGDPYAQVLSTRVNEVELQRTSISDMTFRIERLIHYLSTIYPLEPGDVISTGTPGGVGSKRNPPIYLKGGDVVEVEITGVGTLMNPVADEVDLS